MLPYLWPLIPFVLVVVVALSAAYVIPTATDLVDLTGLLATAPWTAMKMHLSSNNFVPSKASVLTDYSSGEATFTGYSAQTITFGAPYIDAQGRAVAVALVNFVCSAGGAPNSLYTAYATNTAGSVLQFGSMLDGSPRAIVNAGDGVSLVITVNLSNGSIEVTG